MLRILVILFFFSISKCEEAKTALCSAIPADKAKSVELCPSNYDCSQLDLGVCAVCSCPLNCEYGRSATANCSVVHDDIRCNGERQFTVQFECKYCFQTARSQLQCAENFECNAVSPNAAVVSNCSLQDDSSQLCLGRRTFLRKERCNWTSGYKWSTALVYSITLGGFGADRFYLGHWQEGIGKLFSFGGLGVWTLVDVVMVAIGYVGPADGSLYI